MINSIVMTLRQSLERNEGKIIYMIVLGGALCLLPVIGFATAVIEPFFTLAAILAPIGAFILLSNIEAGFVAMLLASIFVRFRLPTGTASEIVMSMVMCGVVFGIWVVRMLLNDKHITIKPSPINAPVIAFVISVGISLIWSRGFRDVLVFEIGSPFVAVTSAVVLALLAMTSLLIVNVVQDIRWLQIIVWTYLGAGMVALLGSLILDLGIGPTALMRQILQNNGLVWINTHGLFSTWFIALALSLALFNKQLSPLLRGALLIYVAGWLYWGFYLRINWLSGWVPAFVAVAVIGFMYSKKLFVLLLVIIVIGAGQYYLKTAYELESERSGQTRLAAYEVNWRVTSKHLFFGTGPAGYASYYMSYFPSEGMASHNNYIDIIAQTGIVGLGAIFWFFIAQVIGSYKLSLELKGTEGFSESFIVAILAGTFACIVAMALGDWLFPFAYTQGIIGFDSAVINWLFMGSAWALYHALPSENTSKETAK